MSLLSAVWCACHQWNRKRGGARGAFRNRVLNKLGGLLTASLGTPHLGVVRHPIPGCWPQTSETGPVPVLCYKDRHRRDVVEGEQINRCKADVVRARSYPM